MESPQTPPSASQVAPCRYLRCNEMYFQADEDDAFASGVYWCQKTHEACGPDGEPCGKKQCCTNRTCYVS